MMVCGYSSEVDVKIVLVIGWRWVKIMMVAICGDCSVVVGGVCDGCQCGVSYCCQVELVIAVSCGDGGPGVSDGDC